MNAEKRRWGILCVCVVMALASLLGGAKGGLYTAFWGYMGYLAYRGDTEKLFNWFRVVVVINILALGIIPVIADDFFYSLYGLTGYGPLFLAASIALLPKVFILAYLYWHKRRNSPVDSPTGDSTGRVPPTVTPTIQSQPSPYANPANRGLQAHAPKKGFSLSQWGDRLLLVSAFAVALAMTYKGFTGILFPPFEASEFRYLNEIRRNLFENNAAPNTPVLKKFVPPALCYVYYDGAKFNKAKTEGVDFIRREISKDGVPRIEFAMPKVVATSLNFSLTRSDGKQGSTVEDKWFNDNWSQISAICNID